MSGVVKRLFEAGRVDELPFIMHRAFSAMLTGRPGPVHVEIPMDIQAEAADVAIHPLEERMALGKSRPDPRSVERAAVNYTWFKTSLIVVGGGAITAEAAPEVKALASRMGIRV